MAGLADHELMARLDWIADCLQPQLSSDFQVMAAQLEAAMPPPLNPDLNDNDFGRFIHAVPGVLAVRHGLEHHPERALALLFKATQRFSMEFYIRPFINRWPDLVIPKLSAWADDPNYHVRRLVSEGTRPKLPWAKKIAMSDDDRLILLNRLYSDPTRFVTRSVANHLNDISKTDPALVVTTLKRWQSEERQVDKELGWITRHALRGLIKKGDRGALALLGYNPDAPVDLKSLTLKTDRLNPGEMLEFTLALEADERCPVIVDYQIWFMRKNGVASPKVFKLKQADVLPGQGLTLTKRHHLKADATTFTLYPGPHRLVIQVNGRDVGEAAFQILPQA